MRNASLTVIAAFTFAVVSIGTMIAQVATGSGSPNTGITPLLASFETGSSSSYITSSTAHAPYVYESLWQGTLAGSALWAEHRIDIITEPGIDVAAGSAASFYVTAHSTNSLAPGNYDETNQVGVYSNCSTPDMTSSVSCWGANFVAESGYNAATPQRLVGAEVDVVPTHNSVPDLQTGGPYSVGVMVHNNTGTSSTGLYGVAVDEISGMTGGWAVGMLSANAIDAGVAVVKNNFSPLVGLYVGAATSWGVYVGCRAIMDPNLNTALQSACDASHNPTIGVALGRTSNTTGASNKLRFESTNGGTEQDYDLLQDSSGIFHMQFSGADRAIVDSNGNMSVAGQFALKGVSGNNMTFAASPTAPRTATFPDAGGTVLETGNGSSPIQTKRGVAGCATTATIGATCTTTVSWSTAFADANYTLTGCTGNGITSGVPLIQGITAKAGASVTVRTVALTAVAAQFTNIECGAVHD